MTHSTHDATTSDVLSWSPHSANMASAADEETADVDEPPDPKLTRSLLSNNFQRTTIPKSHEKHSSLLTKALQSQSDDDVADPRMSRLGSGRRRSMTSNISLASTADLTSDTGLTSPARTDTPSPPLPEFRILRLGGDEAGAKDTAVDSPGKPQALPPTTAPKKRCIQFACAAKPLAPAGEDILSPRPTPMVKAPSAQEAPRKPCIKFACPAPRPASTQNTPPQRPQSSQPRLNAAAVDRRLSPVASKKGRQSQSRSPRPAMQARPNDNVLAVAPTKKYITADVRALLNESSRFHEFASDGPCEDDWIRQDIAVTGRKLTINDTLTKENAIRKLAAECEEEAELEEEEEEAAIDAEDDEDDQLDDLEQDDDEEDEDEDDAEGTISGYNSGVDDSDGYHTDEETGFADSDDENDEDDELRFWTPSRANVKLSGATPVLRRPSLTEQLSDSSIASHGSGKGLRRVRSQRIKIRPGTPELPDSTDFVCGTLDEDRPMETAYLACLHARKREKLQLIPQDIDPSFPTSEPENDDDKEIYKSAHHDSDENVWLHGEMEDLHHETDRARRRKSVVHSPPPKRLHSPPPKARGRSPPPRRLFDRHSPRRLRSPPPQALRSPPASLRHPRGAEAFKELASRPGLTVTKSLPRPPALFPHVRHGRRGRIPVPPVADVHIRGAIDIVKGLEQKRARRKEKFYQKYCDRARKGQIPERKPLPGMGCERMRELGLLAAGKIDQGNYVLSI